MSKIYIMTENDILIPWTGDVEGQGIVRPDHDEKIFSYEAVKREVKANTDCAAGYNLLTGTAVPAGEVWKITGGHILNNINNSGVTQLAVNLSGSNYQVLNKATLTAAVAEMFFSEIYMIEGDFFVCHFYGCILNDDIYMAYHGIKMKVP